MMRLFDRPVAALLLITLSYSAWFSSVSVVVQSWSPSQPPSPLVRVPLQPVATGIGRNRHPLSNYSTSTRNQNHVLVSLRSAGVKDGIPSGEEEQEETKTPTAQTKHAIVANPNSKSNETPATRRDVLTTATGLVSSISMGLAFSPSAALAAEPVNAVDTDSLLAIAKRKLRPKPPRVLRRKLSQDFAVLLMRASYNALDDMDCVAMDQFQRDFFLIRVAEYETYKNQLGAGMVQQGILTDPYYFDFISFAQYKTINREVTQDPPFIFEEQQMIPEDENADKNSDKDDSSKPNGAARFAPVVIKRDPKLTNKMLIPTHTAIVGATILDKLESTFGETDVKIPKIGFKPDSVALLGGLRQIVQLFLINGYAFQGEVTPLASASGALATYKVSLTAPATLWSGRVLQLEGDPLDNDFLLKTMLEYIQRSGYEISKSVTKYDGANQDTTFTVR